MINKIKITDLVTPEMVRGILPIFEKYPDIDIIDITDEFIWLKHEDMPVISFQVMGLKCIDPKEVAIFDIHRFVYMAVGWCEDKGYNITTTKTYVEAYTLDDNNCYDYDKIFVIKYYTSLLHATLAAIKAVWDMEVKNERK